MGGGLASLCLFTRRQVMRVGAVHLRGGMMMRIPWWRLPRMEPPLASTIKLTRNLQEENQMPSRTEVNPARGSKRKRKMYSGRRQLPCLLENNGWKSLLWSHIRHARDSDSGQRWKEDRVSVGGSALPGGKQVTTGTKKEQ